MSTIRFEAELSVIDDTGLVRLSEAASEQLPSRGQVAVHATVDGHPFETVVEPDGRRGHWVRVDRHLQQAAGIGPGDSAEVTLEVAPDWPEPDVPEDLAEPWTRHPRGSATSGRTSPRWPGGSGSAGSGRRRAHRRGSDGST